MKGYLVNAEPVTVITKDDIRRLNEACHMRADAGMKAGYADEIIFFKKTVRLVLKTLGIEGTDFYDPAKEKERAERRKKREELLRET